MSASRGVVRVQYVAAATGCQDDLLSVTRVVTAERSARGIGARGLVAPLTLTLPKKQRVVRF